MPTMPIGTGSATWWNAASTRSNTIAGYSPDLRNWTPDTSDSFTSPSPSFVCGEMSTRPSDGVPIHPQRCFPCFFELFDVGTEPNYVVVKPDIPPVAISTRGSAKSLPAHPFLLDTSFGRRIDQALVLTFAEFRLFPAFLARANGFERTSVRKLGQTSQLPDL